MPRIDPTEFNRVLARLNPQELRQAKGLVADAPKCAEAVLEINARADAGGPAASCPRCGVTRAPGGVGPEQAHSDGTVGVRRDVVRPQRHADGPGSPPRPGGRAGA